MYIIYLFFFVISGIFLNVPSAFGALSCSVTTAAACTSPSTIVLRMSSSTNAHSELASLADARYASNVICCSGLSGISNTCSGTFATIVKLASTTNSHVQQSTLSDYVNKACLSVPSGTVSVGYQSTNCTGYDTTLASLASTTNSHIGDPNNYSIKVCGTLGTTSQTLSFSISDNTIGFGSISASNAQYATGDTFGSSTEVEAHQLVVSTNATAGYTVTVQGATLTAGAYTINAIGSTNTASAVGTKQFGSRLAATGGVGVVTSPYAASGFAYGGSATTSSQVANATSGDGVATTYSVRYIANSAGNTEVGSYTANLVYVVTSNF